MLTQSLLQPKAYIDGPAGGPYMASKQTLRLLTSQSLQASFIVIVLLSSITTNRLHWWDKKKAGIFYVTCALQFVATCPR